MLLSRTGAGKKFDLIFIIINYYTKIIKFMLTCANAITPEFVKLFYYKIKLKYGAPISIILNRDNKIINKF